MLKKIIAIRNIGRFINSALPPLPVLAKHTFVFGANGHGKTTMCAILRSLATNDPALIAGRTRIGAQGAPAIELLVDDAVTKFANGAWTHPVKDIVIFDGTFIAENVFSGDAVDLEQKRNLYRVIVGAEGVALASEEESLAAESRTKASEAKVAEKAIQTHVPRGMTLENFLKLPSEPDVDDKIDAQTKIVEALREAAILNAHTGLQVIDFPGYYPEAQVIEEVEQVFAKTLEGLAEDAQTRISEHVEHHKLGERAEEWLIKGVEHIVDDQCPLCGQSLDGLELVAAFRKVFSAEYAKLKEHISVGQEVIEDRFSDLRVSLLDNRFESNDREAEFWRQYCELPPVEPPHFAHHAIRRIRDEALRLLEQKKASPQEAITLDDAYKAARKEFDIARLMINDYNEAVRHANHVIATKKAAIATGNLDHEQRSLDTLHAQKRRQEEAIVQLCDERAAAQKEKKKLDARKAKVRKKLEAHATTVIKPYETRINQLLDNFNTGFRIAETKSAYPGGVASSTYQLVINDTGIDVGDGTTPIDKPSFKNTLSAGDRSTLALAFFLAHLERDPDRAKRIVVFDDPFTSQDSFRRGQTANEIRKAAAASAQTIVLSHEATFLRQIQKKYSAAESACIQLVDHRVNGVKIVPCDLDNACQGRASSEMDDLQNYLNTGAGKDRDIIKKMRIVLETHCRTVYPGSFQADDRLGGMVEKIKKAGDQHPATVVVIDLDEINDYSRGHHHGEDPTDGSADLIDAQELSGFVKRTLRIVNNLQA
jgi:wobble nucleotide-excising tRNase